MGDLAELRGIILVMTFLSCFFIITSAIPGQLIVSTQGLRKDVDIPDFIEAKEIIQLNYSAVESIHSSEYDLEVGGAYSLDRKIGGHDLHFGWDVNEQYILIHHVEYWWIFKTGQHKMKWYHNGVEIPQVDSPFEGMVFLDKIRGYFDDGTAKFRVQCQHFGMDLILAYNTTAYSSFTEAFTNNDFYFITGFRIDDLNTKLSAWDLVGRLLFFQTPEIHPVLNMIIAIPIWTCIAYLIYVLVLKAIPFVGG